MTDRYERIREALALLDSGDYCERAIGYSKLRRACDPDTIRELLAERDQLAAALEAAREDAERYRWLRDPCSGAEQVIFFCRGDYGRGLMSGTMLDAAIDAAMAKEARND